MRVITSAQAEFERVLKKRNKTKWELFSSFSMVETIHKAKELGWENKLVQVRAQLQSNDEYLYTIEPFEQDCNCPSLLKYSDFFD